MIPILSRAQMRAFDAHAIHECHVPSLVLMENAGRGATDVIERVMLGGKAEGKRVVIACGTGNNGGDGFVVARHLLGRGARVDVWLAGDAGKMTPDCAANHVAFVGLGGRVTAIGPSLVPLRDAITASDVVIDGLFGTGLDRPIVEPLATIIETLNMGRVAALDIPSGVNADTGAIMGTCVRAKLTVTFAHQKLGQLTGSGSRACGRLEVVDIGVPPTLKGEHAAALVEARDVKRWLLPRSADAHKYRAGHVAVIAGSPGKIGASLLCATGVLRGGAGAATIVTWSEAVDSLQSRVVEIMTAPLSGDLEKVLEGKRAVVIGPGFGTNEAAKKVVTSVLEKFTGPIVVDADALSMHAKSIESFAVAGGRAILTPHAGELARLLDKTSEEIEADRFGSARDAAAKAGAVVVLKGAHTVIASPDGRLVVNATGNPALATAGSGDVLAGITGALACTLPPFEAAWCAAYIHGAAGDAWRTKHGDRGLLASEIADEAPSVIASLVEHP